MRERLARLRRPLLVAATAWLTLVALPSVPAVRAVLAWPLIVHEPQAAGDVAYVLSGGYATAERLQAASDLYHLGRVPRLLLEREPRRAAFNFAVDASWDATQWSLGYLAWLGVPLEVVGLVEPGDGLLSTSAEARQVAAALDPAVRRLVVVTSPAHTRRAVLAFRRAMPGVEIVPYAAETFELSAEADAPLWLEYVKLLVYALGA